MGMQHKRLKNRIVRQESRRPRPKTTGPAVPVEILAGIRLIDVRHIYDTDTYVKMLKLAENQMKNIL